MSESGSHEDEVKLDIQSINKLMGDDQVPLDRTSTNETSGSSKQSQTVMEIGPAEPTHISKSSMIGMAMDGDSIRHILNAEPKPVRPKRRSSTGSNQETESQASPVTPTATAFYDMAKEDYERRIISVDKNHGTKSAAAEGGANAGNEDSSSVVSEMGSIFDQAEKSSSLDAFTPSCIIGSIMLFMVTGAIISLLVVSFSNGLLETAKSIAVGSDTSAAQGATGTEPTGEKPKVVSKAMVWHLMNGSFWILMIIIGTYAIWCEPNNACILMTAFALLAICIVGLLAVTIYGAVHFSTIWDAEVYAWKVGGKTVFLLLWAPQVLMWLLAFLVGAYIGYVQCQNKRAKL